MKRLVIDASVAAAAFLNEEHSKAAIDLLAAGHELHVPDLVFSEFGNVLWKRVSRGELSEDEAVAMLDDFLQLPLLVTPSNQLVQGALKLATRTGRTVYDCLYLALAVELKTSAVTADQRFVNSLKSSPLAKHISWIGKQ